MMTLDWSSVAQRANKEDWTGIVPTVPLQLYNAVMIIHAHKPHFWLNVDDIPVLLERHPQARAVILAHNENQIAHAVRAVNIATTTRHNI